MIVSPMHVYYIAYNYGHAGLEMIDGPFGTSSEAHRERDALIGDEPDDEKLVVVKEWKEVTIC